MFEKRAPESSSQHSFLNKCKIFEDVKNYKNVLKKISRFYDIQQKRSYFQIYCAQYFTNWYFGL